MEPIGPVFVAGCPRSGTSALSWAVAACPGYWTSVETHFFYYLSRDNWLENAHANSAVAGSWIDAHAVSVGEFLGAIGEGIDRLMRARSQGRQWVDGSPENVLVGETLLHMFRRAHLLHVVRNPSSVCLSMMTSGFAEPWATDIHEAIRTWNHYIEAGLQLETIFPRRVSQVRQEDMLAAPGAVADRIGARLGIEDVGPIESFLVRSRINSSADKQSYLSPSHNVATPPIKPAAFAAEYGELIRAKTTELAARCGYA